MNPIKGIAIACIVIGVAGLAYGGFTYTRDSSTTSIGPMSITMKDRRTVAVPVWAGIAAVAVGAGLLLVPGRKTR